MGNSHVQWGIDIGTASILALQFEIYRPKSHFAFPSLVSATRIPARWQCGHSQFHISSTGQQHQRRDHQLHDFTSFSTIAMLLFPSFYLVTNAHAKAMVDHRKRHPQMSKAQANAFQLTLVIWSLQL